MLKLGGKLKQVRWFGVRFWLPECKFMGCESFANAFPVMYTAKRKIAD